MPTPARAVHPTLARQFGSLLAARVPAIALVLCSTLASAQSTLGELLQAGAKRVAPDQFQDEVVQRVLRGPIETGMPIEVMYASTGSLQGIGLGAGAEWVQVLGKWTFGDKGSICTSMTLDGPTIRAMLPARCQFWFKLEDRYFVSNSESDARTRVLSRTVRR